MLTGAVLLLVTIYGEAMVLPKHSRATVGAVHKNGLVFEGMGIEELTSRVRSGPRQELPHRLTEIVAANVVHYWPDEGETDPEVQYTFAENWILYGLTKAEKFSHSLFGVPQKLRFARLERWRLERILEKGVGFCSQVSIAAVEFLREEGYHAEVVALDGHVVALVVIDGQEYVLDPDYNVVIPHALSLLEADPRLVLESYLDAGYSDRLASYLARIYGPDGNRIGRYAKAPERLVKATEVLKYVLPIGLLLLGVLAWRRRHGGTNLSG